MSKYKKKSVLMDFRAQQKLQHYIYEHGYAESHRNIYMCNKVGYGGTSVGISSNGENVHLSGLMTCNNLWSCPVCAAIGLTKHARKITTIIEKFRSQDIKAFMVTLTIPHFYDQQPREVLDLHKSLQQKFFSNAFKYNKLAKSIKRYGTISSYECTYGKNGYHFHSHNLIFIHQNDFDKMQQLYSTWKEFWVNLIRKYAPELSPQLKYSGLYISVNPDNTIRVIESGMYITSEMTSAQTKPTHTVSNRNIWELLYSGDDKDMEIFLKYAAAIKFRQKVSYSKTINKFLGLCNEDFDRLGDDVDILKCYRPVCVFSLQTWCDLRESDLKFGTKHRLHIMELALEFDYWGIVEYCEKIGVCPPRLPTVDELIKKCKYIFGESVAA